MPQALSEAQIADFWRDGYLVAPNAVTPALDRLKRRARRLDRGQPGPHRALWPTDR